MNNLTKSKIIEKPILKDVHGSAYVQYDKEQGIVIIHGLYSAYWNLEHVPNAYRLEITPAIAEAIFKAKMFVEGTETAVHINQRLEVEHYYYDLSENKYLTDDDLDYPMDEIRSSDIIVTSVGCIIHSRVKMEDVHLETFPIGFDILKDLEIIAPEAWHQKTMSVNWQYGDIHAVILHDYDYDADGVVMPTEHNCKIVDEFISEKYSDGFEGMDIWILREAVAECYSKFEKIPKPKVISMIYRWNDSTIMLDDYALILPEGYNAEDYEGYKDADIFYYFNSDEEIIGDHGEFTVTAFNYEEI